MKARTSQWAEARAAMHDQLEYAWEVFFHQTGTNYTLRQVYWTTLAIRDSMGKERGDREIARLWSETYASFEAARVGPGKEIAAGDWRIFRHGTDAEREVLRARCGAGGARCARYERIYLLRKTGPKQENKREKKNKCQSRTSINLKPTS